jgi:long-chain acyl-CoA synthetase
VRVSLLDRSRSFKIPAHVAFWSDPLPRTASGKVLKRDLRSLVAGWVEG